MKEVIDYITPYLDKLELEEMVSPVEAAKKASVFLTVLAHLNNFKWQFSQKEVSTKSLRDATLAEVQAGITEEYARSGTKITVGEREALVNAVPEYMESREKSELSKAAAGVINNYIALFTNAHIFYRSLAKDIEDNG